MLSKIFKQKKNSAPQDHKINLPKDDHGRLLQQWSDMLSIMLYMKALLDNDLNALKKENPDLNFDGYDKLSTQIHELLDQIYS